VPARRTIFVLLTCAFLLFSAGSVATASIQDKIDAAKQQAQDLEARISARGDHIAELQDQADAAQARIGSLSDELRSGEAKSHELSAQLAEAEASLRDSQARLERARQVLSTRIVDIYKHGEPDYTALLLSADGFDELTNEASYLRAFEDADARVADRVHSLTEEVQGHVEEIASVKSEIDAHNESLVSARQEVADTRASLQDQASELASAESQESSDLAEIRSSISDLRAQLGPKELGALFGNGHWAIPEYIVMCESGGNYHAVNASSGAGGAYQIMPATWAGYGGKGLPQDAPPAEQDRIAALIWANDGPGAWSCA
jgi:septal ring factor EnvC (AmiA/AmiB activator)